MQKKCKTFARKSGYTEIHVAELLCIPFSSKKKKTIPEREELIKSYISDDSDAAVPTNYSVQKVWETEKKCTTSNTKFACQGFFFIIITACFILFYS